MFGRDKEGKCIECIVEGFNPFYYVKVPEEVEGEYGVKRIKEFVKNNFWMCNSKSYEDPFVKCELVKRKDIYGF